MGINFTWSPNSIPSQQVRYLVATTVIIGSDLLIAFSLQGKVIMITGANTGVGFAAARALAAKDAHVWMASRNPEKQQRYLRAVLHN